MPPRILVKHMTGMNKINNSTLFWNGTTMLVLEHTNPADKRNTESNLYDFNVLDHMICIYT